MNYRVGWVLQVRGEGFLILNGIVSIAFGVFVFFFPGAGALALVWLIAITPSFPDFCCSHLRGGQKNGVAGMKKHLMVCHMELVARKEAKNPGMLLL